MTANEALIVSQDALSKSKEVEGILIKIKEAAMNGSVCIALLYTECTDQQRSILTSLGYHFFTYGGWNHWNVSWHKRTEL